MVEQSTAASQSLFVETEQLARLIGDFKLGVTPDRDAGSAQRVAATARPIAAALKHVGSGAVRKSMPVPAAQSWEEF